MTTPFLSYLTGDSLKKRLLVYFFTRPGERLYLREIAARIHGDPANLSRALTALEKEGVFVSEKRGLQKYFSLSQNYPLYSELKSMIMKMTSAQHNDEERPPSKSVKKANARGGRVYIVAGPNGAGKTTFAKKFLPLFADCKQFINADLIAGGLSPFSPEQSAIQAGRLLLERIRHFAGKGTDFGFETTLAGKSYRNMFADLKAKGHTLHLFFLWIPDIKLAISRIQDRVKRGGHDIPEPVVRRRFQRGMRHLFELYRPFLDSWCLFDNSGAFPHLVAMGVANQVKTLDQELFDEITKQAGVKMA